MSLASQSVAAAPHAPVLLDEVLAAMEVQTGGVYVDGTFGAGGYSRAMLDAASNAKVIGIDRDPNVAKTAETLHVESHGRFEFIAGQFGEMRQLLAERGIDSVDGIVLDIGVSSMQIDEAERGFSFMKDGPLDMRMSQAGESAADVVNRMEEDDLADVIYQFGEERLSRRVAKAIVIARAEAPIETTAQLADIVAKAVRSKSKSDKHPATKTFQALRIYVNGELDELANALESAESLLREGGRLVVVTFHSLEDRMVKEFMKSKVGRVAGQSRHVPMQVGLPEATEKFGFELVKPFPAKPSGEEMKANPRSRSARLRAMKRRNT